MTDLKWWERALLKLLGPQRLLAWGDRLVGSIDDWINAAAMVVICVLPSLAIALIFLLIYGLFGYLWAGWLAGCFLAVVVFYCVAAVATWLSDRRDHRQAR